MSKHLTPLAAALLAVSLMPATASASAAPATYHMQILEPTLKVGAAVPVTIRIIDDASGKPITTASITQHKLQMRMGTMVMPGTITPLPHTDSGDYRFTADLSMAGE
jgi:hypothetical protein